MMIRRNTVVLEIVCTLLSCAFSSSTKESKKVISLYDIENEEVELQLAHNLGAGFWITIFLVTAFGYAFIFTYFKKHDRLKGVFGMKFFTRERSHQNGSPYHVKLMPDDEDELQGTHEFET